MTRLKKKNIIAEPTTEQLEKELGREKYKSRYRKLLRSTVYALLVVAACSVLIATLFLPVLQIYGNSMYPTLSEGEIVVSIKGGKLHRGDVCAFYYNNHILVKRVIAGPSEWVNIDEDGNVFVNDVQISEPYLTDKSVGECDIEFPYQVPENSYFVMGDHRDTSIDSRSSSIGCVTQDEIVGKIVFTVWPIKKIGRVS